VSHPLFDILERESAAEVKYLFQVCVVVSHSKNAKRKRLKNDESSYTTCVLQNRHTALLMISDMGPIELGSAHGLSALQGK